MSKIWLVDIEPIESRYTYYWRTHLPKMLATRCDAEVVVVSGDVGDVKTTEGAFLNFGATNVYKSQQAIKLSQAFIDGDVQAGDVIVFADAWNPVVIMARYMIDLLGVDVKIASIWHAGSYDYHDFLGKFADVNWSFNAERAMFYAAHANFFATDFHVNMFCSALGVSKYDVSITRTGLPFEYIKDVCYTGPKEDIVCFPHRLADEKNYELFKAVAAKLPQYKFIACQEVELSKAEYYDLLSRSKVLFSANKQETLGIGTFEGMASGAIPVVPNRLCYPEMYGSHYLYYGDTVEEIAAAVVDKMERYDCRLSHLKADCDEVGKKFFSGDAMYAVIKRFLN